MSDTQFIKDNLKGSVPTEIAKEVIKNIVSQSTAFKVCKHVPMSSDKKVLPMLSDTGSAYWTEEGEEIQTSIHGWEYPELEAKKLAVIIPFTKEKYEDSVISVMEEIKQGISDAFTKSIDSAIFFGTNTPFDTNIVGSVLEGSKIENSGKLDMDISDAMSKIEASDLVVNGIIAPNSVKATLRTLRDSNGNALVVPGGATGTQIYSTPIHIPTSKVWDDSKASSIVGDFNRAVIGTRSGITYEVLDQATVGGINLAERDLLAIKCTMRFGFKVVDPKAFALIKPHA
ncbi:MAG: phage major capsid protein [Romboutsia timonensis]|uniref:phage major capsid protein n=1 Tax=Romboutsia timonensis TaxID=1776391 RepID=UPI002051CF4A|nr:MAG TPA: Major capsid protein [Caudoviricetes sp.]